MTSLRPCKAPKQLQQSKLPLKMPKVTPKRHRFPILLQKVDALLERIQLSPLFQRLLTRAPPRYRKRVMRWTILFGIILVCSAFFISDNRPIPTPSTTNKSLNVTAVLMNHARPGNLLNSELLPTLLAHPQITEIVILHSNPLTAFEFVHPKVYNINATDENERFGLSLRFHFAGQATNDWILIVDDDMIVPRKTLDALLREFAANPHRIVGRFGRYLSHIRRTGLITHGYQTTNARGGTEVILTKLMLVEREICGQFQEYAEKTDITSLPLLKESRPYWNGEDIFMSLVANHMYSLPGHYSKATRRKALKGINNYAMSWLEVGDVENTYINMNVTVTLSDEKNASISGNFRGVRELWSWKPWDAAWRDMFCKAFMHLHYRGRLWQEAKRRLSTLREDHA